MLETDMVEYEEEEVELRIIPVAIPVGVSVVESVVESIVLEIVLELICVACEICVESIGTSD